MRRSKGSRRIVVDEIEYRWRATGNDGYIAIGIWPTNNIGPFIGGHFRYDETWVKYVDGSSSSAMDQIVITNRIIRRVVHYAIVKHGYDPNAKGEDVRLEALDHLIQLDDAIRAPSKLT